MSRWRRAVLALGILALGLGLAAGPARADADAEARARDAYDRGTAAYKRGDYARAATEYAQADAIAPSAVALRAALDAATLADDPVLGTELVERAAQRESGTADKPLATVLATARARFAHRAGRVVVRCPDTCLATIDGAAAEASRPRIVSVGTHSIVIQRNAGSETRIVRVDGDQVVEVTPIATPTPITTSTPTTTATWTSTPPPVASTRRESPHTRPLPGGFFWAALGATAIAGGFTVWSGIDTANKHSQFTSDHCGAPMFVPGCGGLSNDGKFAQARTNVLIATTGILAATAVALGVFFVRF
jgi:hypothetical protein